MKPRSKSRVIAAAFITVAAFLSFARTASFAAADGPMPAGQRELAIERSLACPQCTDLPLDVCDQDICADMRNVIHQKVAAGESDGQIRQFFVQRYGSRVLLSPPKGSYGMLAWVIPFAVLAAGTAATTAFVRAARRRAVAATPPHAPAAELAGYRTRVERDIRDLE